MTQMSPADDQAHWLDLAVRSAARAPAIDGWEVRLEQTQDRRFVVRNGRSHKMTSNHIAGIGIRAFCGQGTGYAFTNDLDKGRIESVVARAARLAESNAASAWQGFEAKPSGTQTSYEPEIRGDPRTATREEVHTLLERTEVALNDVVDARVTQVSFGFRATTTQLETSTGGSVKRTELLSSLLAQAAVHDGGRRGEGSDLVGGTRGIGDYRGDEGPEALGEAVGHQAQRSLEAVSLPSGRYRTLCDNRLTGILVHESFGHLTEYDLVASGWSVLQDRIGERLARPEVTIRDAPEVDGAPKSGVRVPIDQEGSQGRDVTLLEEGTLTSYLHLRDSAQAHDQAPTGNARCLNVHHPPIVRMRNTFMEPGDLSTEEALELVGDGVYLMSGRGGAPRSDGSFTFTAQRGFRVRDGELAEPLRMCTVNGNVLNFLKTIEGLTRDVEVYSNYFGGCGKWGQSFLHVGFGGPHVVVPDALIGGQGA